MLIALEAVEAVAIAGVLIVVPPKPWIVKAPAAVETLLAAAKLKPPVTVKPLSSPAELFWKSSRSAV
jgi:hypothetical protein